VLHLLSLNIILPNGNFYDKKCYGSKVEKCKGLYSLKFKIIFCMWCAVSIELKNIDYYLLITFLQNIKKCGR